MREHDANTISYKATEKDVGWLFLQFRERDLILALAGRDEVDAASVVAVLLRVDSAAVERATETSPVVVVPTAGTDGTDHVAIVHPAVARVCPAKATYAMPHIHRVLPCYRCEFTDDERPEEAQWRLLRVLVLGKPRPQPAIQMRFAVTATGVKSTGGKKLGIFDIAQVRKLLEDVKTGEGFAEIENWQRRRLTLTRAEGRWTLQEKKGKAVELLEDELAPWLEAFTTRTADEIMLGQEILRTVSSLTQEQRVAFAAGVAERVLDIYAGVAKPYRSSVEAAIDAVWTATEIGEGNASRLRDLRAELEDVTAPYAEEPDLGYSALMAISRAVDAAITKDELLVEQAALHARSAVDLTDRGEHGAAMEEDAFQRRWLEVCRRTDPSSLRAEFRNLNAERPGWLERWES